MPSLTFLQIVQASGGTLENYAPVKRDLMRRLRQLQQIFFGDFNAISAALIVPGLSRLYHFFSFLHARSVFRPGGPLPKLLKSDREKLSQFPTANTRKSKDNRYL
jgi:hypothetical protein